MGFGSNRRGTVGGGAGVTTLSISGDGVDTLVDSNLCPYGDTAYDLGTPSMRWSNVYTGDLHLRNERGDWTIFEEADKIMVKNNLTGEFFNLMLEKFEK